MFWLPCLFIVSGAHGALLESALEDTVDIDARNLRKCYSDYLWSGRDTLANHAAISA